MNKDKGGVIVAFIIILFVILFNFYKEKDLSDNKVFSKAKIIDYFNVGGKKHIKYMFYVNKKRFLGETKVYPFKCDNGIGGCVGEKFKVRYSSKDPNNSEIDLGKYNKFRPNRIRLFE